MQYYSIRFIDVGSGIKNVMKLTLKEIQQIRHLEDEYGLNVASIGSPIGKVKLVDVDDGTKNAFVPFKKYLEKDVKKACELAHAFETKLIRGFSFYPPKGADPRQYLPQAVDQLGQIAETCHRSDLTFGLEIEANLVGQTGQLLAEIHRQVNHPAMVLIFDAANILCQGYTTVEVIRAISGHEAGHRLDAHQGLRPLASRGQAQGHVDEDALKHFVPADVGQGAHEWILRDFRESLPKLHAAAAPPRHSGRVSRPGTARQRRRPVRRLQRARRPGRGAARPVPRARFRPDRLSPARFRRHSRRARVLRSDASAMWHSRRHAECSDRG